MTQLFSVRRWPRALRIGLWVLGIVVALIIILYIGLAAYLHTHRKEITRQVVSQLEDAIEGDVQIGSIETTLLADFPHISVGLRDVSLRDSLYPIHRRELFRFKDVYAQVSPLSMISGDLIIRRVRIKGGAVDVFTDSTGYTNAYLLRSRDSLPNGREKKNAASFRKILLEDVYVTFQHVTKEKLHRLRLNSFALTSHRTGTDRRLEIDLDTDVDGLGFNLDRGSFLKKKTVQGSLDLRYNTKTRQLRIPDQELEVDGEDVGLAGLVDLGIDTPYMALTITSEAAILSKAKEAVAENITRALSNIDMEDPVFVKVFLRTRLLHKDLPYVRVEFNTKNNVAKTPIGTFTDCSFSGIFDNELVAGGRHTDANSYITVRNFKGSYGAIPLRSDSISIQNLITPTLRGRLRSQFDASAINEFTGGKTFHFSSGKADFDLQYTGSLSLVDNVVPDIRGVINIRDAVAEYVPRGLPFKHVTAQLLFEGTHIRLPKVHLQTAGSTIDMSGEARNILAALHINAAPATLEWNVRSNRIDLAEFRSFLGTRGAAPSVKRPPANANGLLADRLDAALARASAHVRASIGAVVFKTFTAEAVTADVSFTEHQVNIQRASLRHAGGTFVASGRAQTNGSAGTSFSMRADENSVRIREIFTAFKNFGQDAITAQNLSGIVSFVADIAGRLNPAGDVVSQSLTGNLNLTLRDGALIGFAPLERVGRFAFKKRNLSDLRLREMNARLHLRGDRIELEPTSIQSSALNINVLGTYGLTKGTDISLQIPLRNPAKDSAEIASGGSVDRSQKGVVVHLRAQNPDGKKLDIDWDRGGKGYKQRLAVWKPGEAAADAVEEESKEGRKRRRK